MNQKLLKVFKNEPKLYETTDIPFWDDEHISQYMLEAHISPELESASRKHSYIDKSVDWIASIMPNTTGKLLDLGCGPGLYSQRFCSKGYKVTGIDFSKRSISYAKEAALEAGEDTDYIYKNYLDISYDNEFDIAVLIYCDFGVLAPENREILLDKIYTALKPGGMFIVDVFTKNYYTNFKNTITTSFEQSGFWSCDPYLCIKKDKTYDKDTYLEQYTIITDKNLDTYNLWNHAFDDDELRIVLDDAGFMNIDFYSGVAGESLDKSSTTLCAVCKK